MLLSLSYGWGPDAPRGSGGCLGSQCRAAGTGLSGGSDEASGSFPSVPAWGTAAPGSSLGLRMPSQGQLACARGAIFLQIFLHHTARKVSGSNAESMPHSLLDVHRRLCPLWPVSSSVEGGHLGFGEGCLDRCVLSLICQPAPSSARGRGASCHSSSPCRGARHSLSRASAAGPSDIGTGGEP